MRVVFMGTPEFAVPSLQALHAHHTLTAVYTQPDRRRGRGAALQPTAVKQAALDLGIEVHQPQTLSDSSCLANLQIERPDVICVAAYGMLLPPDVLALPPHGALNVHASLLPRHRGAAPVHRAVLEGDETTGVAIMQMEEGLDTGPFTNVRTTVVADKSVDELTAELADLGAEALLATLAQIEAGAVSWTEQDASHATYAAKIGPDDVRLRPDLTAEVALRRVRASTRSARAKIRIGDCVLDVLSAASDATILSPGAALGSKDSLVLGFSDGSLEAEEVRPEGRCSMEGCAWARGARITTVSWEPA